MPELSRLNRVLVISPHADDEVLACGGLMARLADQGAEVRVLYMAVDGFHHYGHDGGTTYAQRVTEIEAGCQASEASSGRSSTATRT